MAADLFLYEEFRRNPVVFFSVLSALVDRGETSDLPVPVNDIIGTTYAPKNICRHPAKSYISLPLFF